MVNVDGVVHGNSRCTLAGVDPNRVWCQSEFFAELANLNHFRIFFSTNFDFRGMIRIPFCILWSSL